jgi:hypothetical protein
VPNQAAPILACCDLQTGRILWKQRIKGLHANVPSWVIVGGKRLLVMIGNGTIILGRDAGEKFEELGRTQVLSKTAFAMPALANGRLYARDFERVVCLQLKAPASETKTPAKGAQSAGRPVPGTR